MTTAAPRTSTRATFVVLAAGLTSYSLLQSLVIPVLPTIQHELGTTQADVTWVLTANLLAASIATPILGRLGDMLGKKRVFVLVLVALGVGCLLSALATSLPLMLVGRVVQGIGGGVMPLAFGIVRDEFPDDRVPGAISGLASILAAASGAGVVLAGPIEGALGLSGLFWLPLGVIAAATLAAHVVIPESRVRTAGRINWTAALLLSGWLVTLLLGVSRAPQWGWGSAAVIGLLTATAVLAVLWVVVEARATHPLIDMRMMRLRGVWTANLVALLVGIGMYASFAFLPQFLQTPESAGYGFGATVAESGLIMLPQTAASFVLGLVSGRLGQRFGTRNVLLVGGLLAATGFFALALAHDHRWQVFAATTLVGVGFGCAFASMANVIVAAVPQSQTGVASGMNANIRTIGGAVGSAAMATVVTAHAGAGGLPEESGYITGFLLLGSALLASGLAALLIPAMRRDPVTHEEPGALNRHPQAALVAGGPVAGTGEE
jgi:EmrB/QacA subfamily drug resistance transporter